ncbi:MAG: TRAP transporter large permease subunit [Bauldia sp.]
MGWAIENAPALMCGTLVLLILSGLPVAFALAATGAGWIFIGILSGAMEPALFGLLPSRVFGIISNEMLLAIPFFTFMGLVLERSGIAEDMLRAFGQLFGQVRGGLAVAVVLVGAVIAATTGVVAAAVTAIGLVSLPVMLRHRYSPTLTMGTIAAAGTLAQIIPPSLVLIILAEQLGVSVGDIYTAAVGPGLCLVALYVLYVMVVGWLFPASAPPVPEEENAGAGGPLLLRAAASLVLPTILIAIVLGSVLAGLATATESGALGAVGVAGLGLVRRRLSRDVIRSVLEQTVRLSSSILLIIVGASTFALGLYAFDGADWVSAQFGALPGDVRVFLAVVCLAIFVLSFFLDFFEIAFVVVPLLVPTAAALGVDNVWLGVLIALVIQTAFLHPPFGIAIYVLRSLAPTKDYPDPKSGRTIPAVANRAIYVGAIPFIVLQVLIVAALIWFASPAAEPATAAPPLRLELPAPPA